MASFCYWQVYKDLDFYILLAIACIASLILIYIIRQFTQIIKFFNKIAKKVVIIYTFCLSWAILYIIKIAYLLIQYGAILQFEEEEVDMFKQSQLFCVLDTLPTFFLMYLLILVPYFWLKNITTFLERMKRDQRKDKIILKFFTFYIFLRIFLFLGLFITQLSFSDHETVAILCDSVIMIVLFEVFLSFCLLCYGMAKLFRNFASLNVNEKKDKRKFTNQYLIMIGCSFMRFAMDFYFIILDKTQKQGPNCFSHRSEDYVYILLPNFSYTMLYIVLGQVIMHLTPIITILTIYKIDFKVFDSFVQEDK